jgi:uncharacterized protein (TIGR03435 family)
VELIRAAAALACLAAAQAQTFDVATVRRNLSQPPMAAIGEAAGPPPPPLPPAIRPSPTGLIVENASLHYCLLWALGMKPFQVAGPDWIRLNRYDISAKTGGPVEVEQLKAMLAALLKERFRLEIRRETKDTRLLALLVAPGGSKLTPSAPGKPADRKVSPVPGGGLRIVAENAGIDAIEQILSLSLWPPIVNRTGLTGGFDFTYERPPRDPARPDSWLSDIQAALRKQLGLTLNPQRAPIEIVTIEGGSQEPAANE